MSRLKPKNCCVPYVKTSHYKFCSPVPHLLVSNVAPSEEEIPLIQRAIGETETWVSQHNSEHTVELKDSEHVEAEFFIQQHRAILSAIRNIPVEILQEIVIWTAISEPPSKVEEFRWQLSHISQGWREATVSLSIIWAILPTIRLHHLGSKHARHQVDRLTEVLRRSGDRPLVVTIEDNFAIKSGLYPVLNLLLKYCERWETLSISLPLGIMGAFNSIKCRLPLLKTLSLHMQTGHGVVTAPIGFDILFKIAPLLRRVHTTGTIPHNIQFPFRKLTHYEHLGILQAHIERIVSYSWLESLVITGQTSDPDAIVFPSVTLRYLKKLEFISEISAQGQTLRCFDGLKLPALEELTIVFPFDSPNIIPSVVRMLWATEASSLLRTLHICPGIRSMGSLTTLLKLTPMLVNLETTYPTNIDIKNLASTSRLGALTIVPLLENCKFMFASGGNSSLSSETLEWLKHLALARCGARGSSPMRLSLYSMSVVAQESPWSRLMQAQLEQWSLMQRATGKRLSKLNKLLAYARKERLDIPWDIFGIIDKVQIEDPQDIYASGIHLTLKRMCNSENKSIDARFVESAHRILMRWESLFLSDLQNIHWSCEGPHSVVYVPNGDALRTSANASDIIYGLKNSKH